MRRTLGGDFCQSYVGFGRSRDGQAVGVLLHRRRLVAKRSHGSDRERSLCTARRADTIVAARFVPSAPRTVTSTVAIDLGASAC